MRTMLALSLLTLCLCPHLLNADESAGDHTTSKSVLYFETIPWDAPIAAATPIVPHESDLERASTERPWLALPALDRQKAFDRFSPSAFLSDIFSDHRYFYSRRNSCYIGGILAVGGVMANTNVDDFLRDAYRENVVYPNEVDVHSVEFLKSTITFDAYRQNDEYSDFFHQTHFFGDWRLALPTFAVATAGGWLLEDHIWPANYIGEWGERSLRTMILGGPLVLTTQRLTGGSRPREHELGSLWKPCQDSNGVSGHSYVGAVPFLSAAYMTKRRWLRYSLIAASTLPAISRINDDAHYPSQALMGWSFALLAARAVHLTETTIGPFHVHVDSNPVQPQLLLTYEW